MSSLADRGRPFLTFYDDATGERTELSYATFDNWVAKTSNFLVDALDVTPDDEVGVEMPDHWQKVVIPFAAWRVGAGSAIRRADLTFVAEDRLSGFDRTGVREVVGVSLRPLAPPLSRAWPGVADYADVAAYADTFPGGREPRAPLVRYAKDLAAALGWDARSRIQVLPDADVVVVALAAAQVGAGIVIFATPPADLAQVVRSERITDVVGRT